MTINDIFSKDEIQSFVSQGKSATEIKALARAKRDNDNFSKTTNTQTKTTVNDKWDNSLYMDDGILGGALRGVTTTGLNYTMPIVRGADFVSEKLGFDLVDDDAKDGIYSSSNEMLDDFEKKKQQTSQKGLSKARLAEIKKLEQESSNADGIMENAVVGAKQAYDLITNADEVTLQGTAETLSDPTNYIPVWLGKSASKFVTGLKSKVAVGVGAGAIEGATVGGITEYIVAKGQGKSDEEAKKIAIQSVGAGIAMGTTLGGAGGAYGAYKDKKNNTTNNETQDVHTEIIDDTQSNTNTPTSDTQAKEAFDKLSENPLMNDMQEGFMSRTATPDDIEKLIKIEETKHDIDALETIDATEKVSTTLHEETKLKLQEAVAQGASVEELVSIRNSIPANESELHISKIINNGEATTSRFSGFRIIEALKESIVQNKQTPDEIKAILLNENISEDLANVAVKSYKVKDTSMLEDFIQVKLQENLEVSKGDISQQIRSRADSYNQKLVADEHNWQNSIPKNELDNFISKNIGDENINSSQRELLYELNKLGLVDEVKYIDMTDFDHQDTYGSYGTESGKIDVWGKNDKSRVIQTLTHEYIHGATYKIMSTDKKFYDDIKSIMDEASNKSADDMQYGYKDPYEFVAEAYSNPEFFKELNSKEISPKLRKKLNIPESIKSVWEYVTSRFVESVALVSGKKINIDKKSYMGALDDMMAKKVQEYEDIKTQRANDGTSLSKNLKEPEYKYSDDVDITQSRSTLGDNFTENHYINKDGELVDNGKVLFHAIDKDTKNIDFDALDKFAEPMPEVKSILEFTNDFKDPVSTAIGDLKIDIDYLLNKSIDRDNGTRIDFMNLVKPALENPAYIVKHKGTFNFIKPFIDKRDKVKKFLSVVSDRDGNVKMVSAYKLSNTDIRNIVKNGEVIEDFVSGGISKLASTPPKADLKSPKASRFTDKSISKDSKKSQDETKLYHKDIKEQSETIMQKYDKVANTVIDRLDKAFHGLDKDGNIKQKTWKTADMFRGAFVTNVKKQKEFQEFIQQNKNEKNRLKVHAKQIQDNLNKLNEEDSKLLVLALDGDIPKDKIKDTLINSNVLGSDYLYKTYKSMRGQIDKNMQDLIDAELLDKDVAKEDYVKRFYKEHVASKSILNKMFGSGHKLDSKQFKRKNLTKEQRDNISQIRDAGYVVARTLLEQNRQLQKAKFLETVANEYASAFEAHDLVKVPDNRKNGIKVWGKLNGMYVPQNVMDELNGIYHLETTVDNIVQKTAKQFARWIKGTWTAGNAGTHLYNVISNNLNLYLNGLIFTTKNGRKFGGSRGLEGMKKFLHKDTKEAYKKELTDAGLYDDSFFSVLDDLALDMEANTPENRKWKLKDFYNGALFRQDSKITQKVQDIYDMEDKVFRVFAYEETKWDIKVENYEKLNGKVKKFDKATIAKIEATELSKKDTTKAMNEARDMFVDYSKEVPPIVSTLDNYMVAPFLRYTYLASIRQAKVSAKHPVRALAVGLFLEEGIQAIFGSGDDLDSDDPLKADWMKTGLFNFNMYGANNFIKVGDSKDESTWLNQGRAIPGFRMFGITAGLYGDIYKMLWENKDKYGRDLFHTHDENYQKALKIMSKLTETIMPPMSPIALPVYDGTRLTAYGNIKKDKEGKPMKETITLGGRYAQKLINGAMGGKLDRYGNPLELTDVVKQMFGLKLEKINKKDEATKKLKRLSDEYKPKINKQKSLGDKEKKRKVEKEYNQKVKEIKATAPSFNLGKTKKSDFGKVSFDVNW